MPIINPWLIYALDTVDSFRVFCIILTLVLTAALGTILFIVWCDIDVLDALNIHKKHIKRLFFSILFLSVLCIAMPSSATMTKMVIAKNVTYERADMAKDVVEQVYNDILDVVKQDKED